MKTFDVSKGINQQVVDVLECIASKKVSYLSEIASHTAIRKNRVSEILHDLHQADMIERIYPAETMTHSDQRLLDRRSDFWKEGMRGNNQKNAGFQRPKFYGLNSDLTWSLKVDGSDIRVDEYHNRTFEKPEMKTISLLKDRFQGVSNGY